MSKFFHLNDYKVRLSANNAVTNVIAIEAGCDDHKYGFNFVTGNFDSDHLAAYATEAEAVAVHAKFMEALEGDA